MPLGIGFKNLEICSGLAGGARVVGWTTKNDMFCRKRPLPSEKRRISAIKVKFSLPPKI
jgi:hypothetical protein